MSKKDEMFFEQGGQERTDTFRNALGKLTFEVAGGAAIRHLIDHGFSAKEIQKKLTYPLPIERIRNEYTVYLLEQKIIAPTIPKSEEIVQYEYISETNELGRKSYRRVPVSEADNRIKLPEYIECIFVKAGVLQEESLKYICQEDAEYLRSIDWSQGIRYHILNERMEKILSQINASKVNNHCDRANDMIQ